MKTSRPYQRVAVLMGGPSAERDVSLRSGQAVARGLEQAGYAVAPVDVQGRSLALPAGAEAVFIALHGEFGEDGGVQALLDRMGVPYTGSGAEASRLSFDKKASKGVFAAHAIPTPAYECLKPGDARSLPLPVVTKPLRQGSSIGVHIVTSEPEWNAALADTRRYGEEVLVERYVEGIELTAGVVDNEALPVVQILAPEGNYDYRAKYTKGMSRYLVPADIGADLERAARTLGLETFRAFGCRGLGRVDIRVAADGAPYVLELNSIPGFTETSLLPMAAGQAGMTFPELCDRIMRTAQTA